MLENNEGETPEVDVVQSDVQEEQVEQKSMDDTIREALRNIQERNETGDSVQSSAEPSKNTQERDPNGKFTQKAPEENKVVTTPETQAENLVPQKRPPNAWRKEVAEKWATLPPEVQEEVERRENDFHKGIEQYRQAASFGQAMEKAITPYAQTIQSLGITADKAISELMAADHKLRYGSPQEKTAYFAQLAQSYGIELGQAQTQAHAMPQQAFNPDLNALQQKVEQFPSLIEQKIGEIQKQAALNSEIDAFKSNPAHVHFETVKGHMAALLQAGQAQTLSEAYEQAIYANPTTRAAVLEQQAKAQREEAAKRAQAAKTAASVNVRSRPPMPIVQQVGTMEDTIRNAYLQLTQNQ